MYRSESVVGARPPDGGSGADSLAALDRDVRQVRVRRTEPSAMVDGDRETPGNRPREGDNTGTHRRHLSAGKQRHIHTPMTAVTADRSETTDYRPSRRHEPGARGHRDQDGGKEDK